ncbi:cell growth regulator with EF hand domain protein 1 isoform X1 [Haemorhous mexicanus]|uniref:cell growth regulator with EF hand domain protein 1 isoform X1 n=1 Tax=Haemorhous mexicanus TaxID=30427 RepID=UPI0028BED06F|nr:cell growth regulator with EF hand domain protein 1 isoform X1 [Haemorhous mexicanus]XP_059699205.1 cell growth regulator with EF hand domain protein 1 isoform X1 [Haemorhous mexicanus]
MRNPPVMLLLLLLLGPAAWAAPRAGTNRPEPPVATIVDPYPDPLSPEPPALLLLWSAVRSLGPPEQDVQAMTREQALLYLFVLHDHDQSRHLDGLELLQLLGTVLAQAGRQPDPDMVAALVDQALARQDLNGDGLLNPSELLDPPEVLLPGQDKGPPGQPPLGQQEGLGAVPAGDREMPRQDLGLKNPGQETTEAGEPQTGAPEAGDPQDRAPEARDPQDGVPAAGDPQDGVPAAGDPQTGAPAAGDPQTGAPEAGEPQTGAPAAGDPQTGAPEAGEPQTGAPAAGDPQDGVPVAGDPQTGAPEDGAWSMESLEVESPNAEALEAEVVPGAEVPSTDATEEEEAPEAEAPEEQAAPAWRDHGEG